MNTAAAPAPTTAPPTMAGSHHSAYQVTLHAPSLANKGESLPLSGRVTKIHHPKTPVVIQAKHGTGWKIDSTTTNKKGSFHADVLTEWVNRRHRVVGDQLETKRGQ